MRHQWRGLSCYPEYVCLATRYACYQYRLRLSDGDLIDYTVGSGSGSSGYEFKITKSPHIAWYRGVRLYENGSDCVGELGVKDSNNESGVLSFVKSDDNVHVIFTEAKFFGFVTRMCRLNRLQDKMSSG